MARTGITYVDVRLAAERLVGKGMSPTVDSVRFELGNTGSKSTIAPMLKQWKDERIKASPMTPQGLPPSLLQTVETLYQGLLDQHAEKEAQLESSFAKARVELQAKTERLQDELDSLRAEYDALKSLQSATRAKLEAALEEGRKQTIAYAAKVAECAGHTQRLADRGDEIKMLKTQLSQGTRMLKRLEQSLEAQVAADRQADAFARAQTAWDSERHRLLAELAKSGGSLNEPKNQTGNLKQRATRHASTKK